MKTSRAAIRASNRTAEVLIYEDIGEDFFGGLGAKAFREQISALTDVDTITVRINSDGGDVFQGVAIYNTLKDHPAKKNVIIDGLAASVATVIAMAGDTITIQPTATMMIHNATGTFRGDGGSLRKSADLMDLINSQMTIAYARSGKSEEEILKIMEATTWYSAQAAVDAGWADALVAEPMKLAASLKDFDLSAMANVPRWLTARQAAAATPIDACTCECTPCMAGDCKLCDHSACDCEGCSCPMNSTAKADKIRQNDEKTAEIQQKAVTSARIRADNLRLAEL